MHPKTIIFLGKYCNIVPISELHDIGEKLSTIYLNRMEMILFENEPETSGYFNEFGHALDEYDPTADNIAFEMPTYKGGYQMSDRSRDVSKITDDTPILNKWSEKISFYKSKRIKLGYYVSVRGRISSSENVVDAHIFTDNDVIVITVKTEGLYVSYLLEPLEDREELKKNLLSMR
jgi:hypothetical protein